MLATTLKIAPFIYDSLFPLGSCQVFYNGIQSYCSDEKLSKMDIYSSFHSNWTSEELGIGHICGSNFTQEYSNYLRILGKPFYTPNSSSTSN